MDLTSTRRSFLKNTTRAAVILPLINWKPFHKMDPQPFSPVCVFSKHLQFLPDYTTMAEVAAEIGFDGVDLTVRPGGHVLPEEVEKNLPIAVKAVEQTGLKVPMITTRILKADEPYTLSIIQTAQEQGISYYRMGYYSYDMDKGVGESLKLYKPHFEELAKLNEYYRIHGAYQNHDGNRVGAAVWDIWELVRGTNPEYMGVQYDIRHATAEGGKSWVLDLNLVKSHIRSIVIKDFRWEKDEKGKWYSKHVPLGKGMVDFENFFSLLKSYKIQAPISMHFEYDWYEQSDSLQVKKEKTITAMKRDLNWLRETLESTYGER